MWEVHLFESKIYSIFRNDDSTSVQLNINVKSEFDLSSQQTQNICITFVQRWSNIVQMIYKRLLGLLLSVRGGGGGLNKSLVSQNIMCESTWAHGQGVSCCIWLILQQFSLQCVKLTFALSRLKSMTWWPIRVSSV